MKQYKVLKDYIEKDELNIEKVINEYSGYAYTIIKNISNEQFKQEDIEETISDAFLILWKNASKMHENDKITSYLAGVIHNLIKKKNRKITVNFNIEDYENSIEDKKQLEEFYEKQDKIEAIRKVVEKMSSEDNEIFELFYYSEKKVKEIANKLNITEFKVKTKLYRIRKKIKQELEKEGYRYE